jgi:integrase
VREAPVSSSQHDRTARVLEQLDQLPQRCQESEARPARASWHGDSTANRRTTASSTVTGFRSAMKLPYRKPHVMRHSYATWLHEAGADIRWAQRQHGHATIAQTSDTYGHLESERHDERVNLDEVLTLRRRPATSYRSHPRIRSPARTRNAEDHEGRDDS